MNTEENLVRIATLGIEDESSLPLIRAELEKENIPYQVRSHHDTAYNGVFTGQKGVADIYVYQKDERSAQQILSNLLR